MESRVSSSFPTKITHERKQQDYHARLANMPAELETLLSPLVDAAVDIVDASTRRFDMLRWG